MTDSRVSSPLWQEPKTTAPNPDTTAPDAAAERYRAQLKELHGDIPEVDMFIELHKRMFRDKNLSLLTNTSALPNLQTSFIPHLRTKPVSKDSDSYEGMPVERLL